MSIIEDANKNLPQVIDTYQKALEEVEDNLKIRGKRLEWANVEQAAWLSYYDERRIELRVLVKHLEAKVQRKRGQLWIFYTEQYNRELGPKDKDQYINTDEQYLTQYDLLLEVEELYKKYDSVVEAFRSRGYALRNITEIRVHSLEDAIV